MAKLLYNLWRFCYTICGFASYGNVSCLIEREIEGQSENSVAILLSGYSFVSLRHETMASITDSIS